MFDVFLHVSMIIIIVGLLFVSYMVWFKDWAKGHYERVKTYFPASAGKSLQAHTKDLKITLLISLALALLGEILLLTNR